VEELDRRSYRYSACGIYNTPWQERYVISTHLNCLAEDHTSLECFELGLLAPAFKAVQILCITLWFQFTLRSSNVGLTLTKR
jgi:hypothetical protein